MKKPLSLQQGKNELEKIGWIYSHRDGKLGYIFKRKEQSSQTVCLSLKNIRKVLQKNTYKYV